MHGLSWEILMATPRTKERSLWYTLGLIEPIADVAIMLHSFKAIAITIGSVTWILKLRVIKRRMNDAFAMRELLPGALYGFKIDMKNCWQPLRI